MEKALRRYTAIPYGFVDETVLDKLKLNIRSILESGASVEDDDDDFFKGHSSESPDFRTRHSLFDKLDRVEDGSGLEDDDEIEASDEFDDLSDNAFPDDDPEADENCNDASYTEDEKCAKTLAEIDTIIDAAKKYCHIPAEIPAEDDEAYDTEPPKPIDASTLPPVFDPKDTYAECVYNAMICGTISEMTIQRNMPIGYTQTLKILKQMQDDGYIKPYRKKCGYIEYKSIITEEQFRERFCLR